MAKAQPALPETTNRGAALVNAASSMDEAWSVFANLAQPKPLTDQMRRTVGAFLNAPEQLMQASQAAKAFYGRYPNSPHAAEARKAEAMLALQAVQLGGTAYKSGAVTCATAYRAEKSNPDQDRFDVAFAVDGLALAEILKGKRFIDDGEKYEKLADSLRDEFGYIPAVYGLYVSIVRTTDVATSTRVASKLLAQKATPEWVKTQSQLVVDRSKLIGKVLELKLAMIGGGSVDLSQPCGRPTVIYFWHSAGGPRDFAALEHFKPSISVDCRWLYVGLGSEPLTSDRPMAGTAYADTHCFESMQPGNPSTTYLKLSQAPYALVLDAEGLLVGYGPPETIAALLKLASH